MWGKGETSKSTESRLFPGGLFYSIRQYMATEYLILENESGRVGNKEDLTSDFSCLRKEATVVFNRRSARFGVWKIWVHILAVWPWVSHLLSVEPQFSYL